MKRLVLIPFLFVSFVQAQEIVIREGLGIRVPGARRSAVHVDPVEHLLITGKWKAPTDGKEGWTKASANAQAEFRGGPIAGGYLYTTVDVPNAKVMLLEASGHTLVYVNGVPRAGDPYSYGYVSLPVELRKGKNELLFLGGRGRLVAKLVDPPKPLSLDLRDATLPDVLVGSDDYMPAGIVVRNATNRKVQIVIRAQAGDKSIDTDAEVMPLSVRKVAAVVPPAADGKVTLQLRQGGNEVDRAELALRVRNPRETHKRTFMSLIDGSAQYFGVNPSLGTAENQAMFLSLHGASVEAIGQAEAYGQKNWGNLVAATNRRPYGFDWEEIGRLDALEVLEEAKRIFTPDPTRIYLTGHSMGGHGTWQLGVHYPHLFAAIAPSAGWISFQSYANGQTFQNATPVEQMLLRAGSPSDTLGLKNNLLARGVYVLHGDADDNVPVAQARQMREALKDHRDLAWHEQKGAGHWWDADPEPGSDAVDFAPIFDFFARRRLPRYQEVREVDFTTASPGISSQLHWATIHQQEKPFQLSRVRIKADPLIARFSGTTENVSVLSLGVGSLADGKKIVLEIDGQKLEPDWPTVNRVYLHKKDGKWQVGPDANPAEKSDVRNGGFKDVYRNRVAFVYGTQGNAAENAWAFAKARYDAETFWYRGNGSVDVLADSDVKLRQEKRNYILYGNAQTNAAWQVLLADSPVQVTRQSVKLGTKEFKGDDLSAYFIRPLAGTDNCSVGVIAGTGIVGMRLSDRVPVFTSGSAFPDLIVYGSNALVDGSKGIRITGFFGNDWRVESGEWAEQQ
jgi:poly(3-hydroxybutyrate) depolymerase